MGGGPKPGIDLGVVTCTKKTPAGQDRVTVSFSGGSVISGSLLLSAEDAEYFVVAEVAGDLSFKKPG